MGIIDDLKRDVTENPGPVKQNHITDKEQEALDFLFEKGFCAGFITDKMREYFGEKWKRSKVKYQLEKWRQKNG